MGTFDYNSFINLSYAFDLIKGQVVPPTPKARVILYSQTAIKSIRAMQSRFVSANDLPDVRQPFSSKARGPVRTIAIVPPAPVSAPAPVAEVEAPVVPDAPVAAAETTKPRGTLKLKTKVELPPITARISRSSSVEDLAAAFKAEMALMEKQARQQSIQDALPVLEDRKKKRHPLSDKSWSELFAEVEKAKPAPTSNFDLANAFKAEMKAFMAQQAKNDDVAAPELKKPAAPAPRYKLAA